MRLRSATTVLLGLAFVGVGWAAKSGTAEEPSPRFTSRPCQDGWLGCIVDGERVSPENAVDTKKRPMPSSMRLGFFDLEPTVSFSVHEGLSRYNGEPVAQIQEEPEAPPPEPTPEVKDTGEAFLGDGSSVEPEEKVAVVVDKTPEPPRYSTPDNNDYSSSPEPVKTPPKDNYGGSKTPDKGVNDAVVRVDPEPPKAPVEEIVADCDDLRQLEGTALLGALTKGHTACLEGRIKTEKSQTKRNKISRVLLINAEASKNGEWARLMRRHLEDIDRSDPDMCFKYAFYLSKKRGASSAYGVIKWAGYALENKSRWSGPTFTKRVYDLMKLRAHAANRLWQRANEDLLNAGSNREELAGKEEKARGKAKSLAREWLDFARAASQNTSEAMSLCISTAGSKKFCKD